MHCYTERDTPGKRHYELHDGVLKISGKQGFGRFVSEVHLGDIAPHFERVKCFHQRALNRTTLYLAVLIGALSLLVQKNVLHPFVVALISVFFVLPGIMVLFRYSRRMELERFKSHTGVVVFDLIREKRQADEFDQYVQLLRGAVLEAQRPNKAPEPTPGSVTPRATSPTPK